MGGDDEGKDRLILNEISSHVVITGSGTRGLVQRNFRVWPDDVSATHSKQLVSPAVKITLLVLSV